VVGLSTLIVAIAIGAVKFAQAPPTAQPNAATNGPPANSAARPKAGAPAAEAQPTTEPQQPQLNYSPWTKLCTKGQEANAPQVCVTGTVGRVESGVPSVAAMLIEPEGQGKKVLRVTLPLGTRLPQGTRLIVDQGQPLTAPYILCLAGGCVADYEASQELIGNMKKGQRIAVEGINSQGQTISLPLPLNGFGKAYDGPPTEPKASEAQQGKLHNGLERRAEEVRQKLEGQQLSP